MGTSSSCARLLSYRVTPRAIGPAPGLREVVFVGDELRQDERAARRNGGPRRERIGRLAVMYFHGRTPRQATELGRRELGFERLSAADLRELFLPGLGV